MEKNQHIKPSVIQIRRLRKVYRLEDESVVALHSISADIRKGENLLYFRHLWLRKKYFAEPACRNGEADLRFRADRQNRYYKA